MVLQSETAAEGCEWYGVVDSDAPLEQGDFVSSCPIATPVSPVELGLEVDFEVSEYDVIIISHSCDLVPRKDGKVKLKFVLVCPVWPLGDLEAANPFYRSDEGKESLRRGYQPSYHLLNRCTYHRGL